MALRVYPLGPVLVGGGTIFVCTGAPPNVGVRWILDGLGALIPFGTKTSSAGVAIARYDAPGHSRTGYKLTVSAEVWP